MIKEVYPLLSYEIKDNHLVSNGPFSPVHAANTIAKISGVKLSHLCRIVYIDETFMQYLDNDGYSSYDHLVLVQHDGDNLILFYFVDMGYAYLPVAGYFSKDDLVTLIPSYIKSNKITDKLTKQQLRSVFKYILANEETYMSFNYKKLKEEYGKSKV